jgi:ferrous iron transport protein A
MPEKMLVNLRAGENGVIVRIDGGQGVVNRLAALDIRPGKKVKKINTSFLGGPVTVEVNRTKVAIGFGWRRRSSFRRGTNRHENPPDGQPQRG